MPCSVRRVLRAVERRAAPRYSRCFCGLLLPRYLKRFVNVKRGAATPTKEVGWDKVNEINTKNFEEFLAPILK